MDANTKAEISRTSRNDVPPWSWFRLLAQRLNQTDGLSWRALWLVFFAAAVVIIAKGPQVLSNPQFYAEGGMWYAGAYNHGWLHSLVTPSAGYLVVFCKLVVGLSLLVPLQFAPLLMNFFGIIVQALPVPFLLSGRCSTWGRPSVRAMMAVVYLLLPNNYEIHVGLPNTHWHLALLACLVVFATPAVNWRMMASDVVILTLAGLTGPFCLFLCPLAAVYWWLLRGRWRAFVFGLLTAITAIQGAFLMCVGLHGRVPGSLGATPLLFVKLLTGQVYLGALLGANRFANHANFLALAVVLLGGTVVWGYCLLKGRLEIRLFIVFSALLLAASLYQPLIAGPQPPWELLLKADGSRYWFFPMLAVSWSLIWCATGPVPKPLKILGVVALIVMLRGMEHNWKQSPFADEHFQEHARQFAAAPDGTEFAIPISPEPWTIHLIKHQ